MRTENQAAVRCTSHIIGVTRAQTCCAWSVSSGVEALIIWRGGIGDFSYERTRECPCLNDTQGRPSGVVPLGFDNPKAEQYLFLETAKAKPRSVLLTSPYLSVVGVPHILRQSKCSTKGSSLQLSGKTQMLPQFQAIHVILFTTFRQPRHIETLWPNSQSHIGLSHEEQQDCAGAGC